MLYKEEKRDLFDLKDSYYLAHCISADFGMGAGIAVLFNQVFDMKNKLIKSHERYKWNGHGRVEPEGTVLNLITKEKVWEKPTNQSVAEALEDMKNFCIINNIVKVAMPLIGCGIDGLLWDDIKNIIQEIFEKTDIEVCICYL